MNKSYRENRRGNQEWTIERYRQHWTQTEKTEGAIKNGQLRDTGNIGHKPHHEDKQCKNIT